MLSALLMVVVIAMVVGVLVWGLGQLPWIDANIKKLLTVVIIVAFSIWAILAIAGAFGVHTPALR